MLCLIDFEDNKDYVYNDFDGLRGGYWRIKRCVEQWRTGKPISEENQVRKSKQQNWVITDYKTRYTLLIDSDEIMYTIMVWCD